MKYIKLFELSNKFYEVITYHEYDGLVNGNTILNLTYREQELLISLFEKKFIVKESLDSNCTPLSNEAAIGFNRVDPDTSCWINITTTDIHNNGLTHEISISKLEDEWFVVRGVWNLATDEEAKCDQIQGLLEYFRDRFNIGL